jgi:hypothetical protein
MDEIQILPLIYAALKARKAYKEILSVYKEVAGEQYEQNYELLLKTISPFVEELQQSADAGAADFIKKYKGIEPLIKLFLNLIG